MPSKIDLDRILRELSPGFAAQADKHDADDSFVSENYAALKAARVFSALVPEDLGGGRREPRRRPSGAGASGEGGRRRTRPRQHRGERLAGFERKRRAGRRRLSGDRGQAVRQRIARG